MLPEVKVFCFFFSKKKKESSFLKKRSKKLLCFNAVLQRACLLPAQEPRHLQQRSLGAFHGQCRAAGAP
jgi:hypothetical protein